MLSLPIIQPFYNAIPNLVLVADLVERTGMALLDEGGLGAACLALFPVDCRQGLVQWLALGKPCEAALPHVQIDLASQDGKVSHRAFIAVVRVRASPATGRAYGSVGRGLDPIIERSGSLVCRVTLKPGSTNETVMSSA